MPRTHFKFLYVSRRSRLPVRISALFEEAGYSISQPRRALAEERSRLFAVELESAAGRGRRRTSEGTGPATLALSLRGLRERSGRTQREIARRISMTQPQLSRVEARHDHLTSTLRKYVGALGGRIEVVAVVDGRRIVLRGV